MIFASGIQSIAGGLINKITLEIVGRGMIHFPVNPESIDIIRRYLVNVSNTLNGGWVDDYGIAPSPIVMNGTFGKNLKIVNFLNPPLDGLGVVKYLEELIDESKKKDKITGELPEVRLYIWLSGHHFKVTVEEFKISQTVSRNTIWTYSLRIRALESLFTGLPNFDALRVLGGLGLTTAAQSALGAIR